MSSDHKQPAKSRVLVCDDSKMVRATAKKFLAQQFDLVLAEDGEDAWEQITADPSIQVVFTDLGMPRLDGYGLIQRVRKSPEERIRNLPLIVITGAAEEEGVRREVFEIGATDFISKPFKSTTLIARADAHTSYQRVNSTLQESSNLDPETGLLNSKGIKAQLDKDISFVNRHSENLALVIFELDDYDAVYDRIGQKTSDAIIKEVMKSLRATLRKEDSLGRDGLARFVVSLPMAKPDGVVKMAKRLCSRVASFKLKANGSEIPLTLSAGIATIGRQDRPKGEELITCAEQALVNANALGVGEVQLLKLEAELDDSAVAVSIDDLLEQLALGEKEEVSAQLDAVVDKLAPLIDLMSDEHKTRLLQP